MSFSQVRAEIRGLETECDRELSKYSALVSTPQDAEAIGQQLRQNLQLTSTKTEDLFRLANEPGASAAWQHQAQRHREVLEDHRNTFKRLSDTIATELNRQSLLSSVRYDIEAHRAASAGVGSEDEYYATERGRVENSNSLADSLLQQAYETRAEFTRQTQSLRNIQHRIWHSASRMPGVNALISKINTRQKRNSLVMATVVTVCILLVVYFR